MGLHQDDEGLLEMSMKVVGVDLGARKAALAHFTVVPFLVVKERCHTQLTKAVSLYVLPKQENNRGKELAHLMELVIDACIDADYVWIEEPLVGRGIKASMMISQTAGALMAGLSGSGVHTEMVNVKTWKKSVVGNGNASKDDVSMFLQEQFPLYSDECGTDQDKRDAVCVGLYGISVLQRVRGWLNEPRGGGQSDGEQFPFLGDA